MEERSPTVFTFNPLGLRAAYTIAGWHYAAPYDFYDFDRSSLFTAVLLRSLLYHIGQFEMYAVYTNHDGLVGYFDFLHQDSVVKIGLAMRPDLTGKGRGLEFVSAGMNFGKMRFLPTFFRLDVAAFNQRAITVYSRAGFRPIRTFTKPTRRGILPYQEMQCEA